MRLLVINPNTTAAMTEAAVAQVQRLLGPDAEVRGVTASSGPPVIASRESFVAGAHAALQAWHGMPADTRGRLDGVILACFGDPGLAALQEVCGVPVAGMAQAALREAIGAGRPYRIITAGAAWEAMLLDTVRLEQATGLLDGIVVLQGTGLDAARDRQGFVALVQDALDRAAGEGSPTVILGGAGFAGFRESLRYPGLLIDGLEAAARSMLAVGNALENHGKQGKA
ncbi:MAG: aspartate/glutamate racemase family protein [Pseudomonadota bacterium]